MKVSASFLSSKDKIADIKRLNMTDVDYIHVDYIDGTFVPGKSLSFRELKKIYKYTCKRLDVHLMMENPGKLISKFAKLNTEFITIHVELKDNIPKLLEQIRSYGIKAGLAVNPMTDVQFIIPYLDKIDMVVLMSVEPGIGGQAFLEGTKEKLEELKKLLVEHGKENILISVDGGVNARTKDMVQEADILVSGVAITGRENFQEAINEIRQNMPLQNDEKSV